MDRWKAKARQIFREWRATLIVWLVQWIGGSAVISAIGRGLWQAFHRAPLDWYFICATLIVGVLLVVLGVWLQQRQSVSTEGKRTAATTGAPKPESKLKIHRVTYGVAHAEMSPNLQDAARDALVIHVDSTLGGLLPRDPAIGVRKHLEVDYSYESDTNHHVSRLEPLAGETMRLVLPEDTEVLRLQAEIIRMREAHNAELSVARELATGYDQRYQQAKYKIEELEGELSQFRQKQGDPSSLEVRARILSDDLYGFLAEFSPEPPLIIPTNEAEQEIARHQRQAWSQWHDRMFWGYGHRFRQRVESFVVELRAAGITFTELVPTPTAAKQLELIRELAEKLLILSKNIEFDRVVERRKRAQA